MTDVAGTTYGSAVTLVGVHVGAIGGGG